MANTLNLGTGGNWAAKEGSLLAYNDENGNFKPLPFDFTRASSATRVNSQGLIEVVERNQPRVDYSSGEGALLLEPSRSNFIRYSNEFDNAAWDKGASGVASAPVVTSNQGVSPDGTNNAFKIDFNLNGGTSTVDRSRLTQFFTGTISTNYTFTYWIKAFSVSDVGKVLNFAVDNVNNFGNITVTENWQKIVFTGQSIGTIINYHIQLRGGYGTSDSVSILLYGYQAEEGSYATSYIPTQGAAVTRVQDVCNNGANEQVINSTEGVLYAEISAVFDNNISQRISISDGTANNHISIDVSEYTDTIVGRVRSSNIEYAFMVASGINKTNINKIALKYKSNDSSLWINGTKLVTDTSVTMPIGLSELSFDRGENSNPFYGNVKDVKLYNTVLTDEQLAALTTI